MHDPRPKPGPALPAGQSPAVGGAGPSLSQKADRARPGTPTAFTQGASQWPSATGTHYKYKSKKVPKPPTNILFVT
jgi:hypothetical protein